MSIYQRIEQVAQWLYNKELLNWPDYFHAMFLSHWLVLERTRPELLCNDQSKTVPKIAHRWLQFAV